MKVRNYGEKDFRMAVDDLKESSAETRLRYIADSFGVPTLQIEEPEDKDRI